MSNKNYGSQGGENSFNVGVGDFRGASLNINDNSRLLFTPEQMEIKRHQAFGGGKIRSQRLSVFGCVTGVASFAGLYFTLFQPFPNPRYASWSTAFFFMFGIAVFSILVAVVVRRRKFEHLLFRKYYIEAGSQSGLYLSRFTAKCPWCESKMNLRNIGEKGGARYDYFICERNPRQHTIELDPTVLSEIEE